MALDVREQKKQLQEKLMAALKQGISAIETVLEQQPLPDEVEGPVGEVVEKTLKDGNVEVCRYLVERFHDSGLLNRRLLEDFLTNIREHLFTGTTQQKNELFDYLSSLPSQVNSSSIWVATTVTGGATFVRKLKAIQKKLEKEKEAAEVKRAKPTTGNEEEEEKEDGEGKPELESKPFLAGEFVDLLDCKKLLIWGDGLLTEEADSVTTAARKSQPLAGELVSLSEACLKMDKEFAKEEWELATSNEEWRGFFIRCPPGDNQSAGNDFARAVLGVNDKGDKLEVKVKSLPDTRQTLWPQRYYYEGHVSKSKLARVKRASNLVKAQVKKNTLCEVMFHCPERAWYWPPVALVGRSKAQPEYLIGLLYITHDQEHLHHGQ